MKEKMLEECIKKGTSGGLGVFMMNEDFTARQSFDDRRRSFGLIRMSTPAAEPPHKHCRDY
jgi:hypothetical protein